MEATVQPKTRAQVLKSRLQVPVTNLALSSKHPLQTQCLRTQLSQKQLIQPRKANLQMSLVNRLLSRPLRRLKPPLRILQTRNIKRVTPTTPISSLTLLTTQWVSLTRRLRTFLLWHLQICTPLRIPLPQPNLLHIRTSPTKPKETRSISIINVGQAPITQVHLPRCQKILHGETDRVHLILRIQITRGLQGKTELTLISLVRTLRQLKRLNIDVQQGATGGPRTQPQPIKILMEGSLFQALNLLLGSVEIPTSTPNPSRRTTGGNNRTTGPPGTRHKETPLMFHTGSGQTLHFRCLTNV